MLLAQGPSSRVGSGAAHRTGLSEHAARRLHHCESQDLFGLGVLLVVLQIYKTVSSCQEKLAWGVPLQLIVLIVQPTSAQLTIVCVVVAEV